MIRFKTPVWILMALAHPGAFAQDGVADGSTGPASTERVEGAEEDRLTYRATIDRYSERMDEFRDEVRSIVDQKEAQEREDLLKGFEHEEGRRHIREAVIHQGDASKRLEL